MNRRVFKYLTRENDKNDKRGSLVIYHIYVSSSILINFLRKAFKHVIAFTHHEGNH